MEDVGTLIRQFVVENLLYRDEVIALRDDTSFLETGLIDSTGVLELVGFIEHQFGLRLRDEEIIPDNLDSVRRIAAFVQRKRGARLVAPAIAA